ncbi:hypothetical protein BLA14095_00481 [Burkholderia lata]|uniref:hypothetical protein n=1 Tax=Burkholderia lata (strain ATCC 17760 / DSM 23089 / LMG 22485 / NCIMB 9086 / R18194 / 383) TaxID=482957 RepID=UPI0014538996|nr:hypothetical protein [Burkholderia lata]VWB16449.1 hypothetical protein BLA14095_00481 [Burkholderia lata]
MTTTTDKSRADALTGRQRRIIDEAAKHLTAWLDTDSCDCDGYGHSCGRPNVQRTRDELLELLAASPVEQHEAAPADDARECLMDVVSHHDNIVAGFAAQRLAAIEAADSDTAAYWGREIEVARRMKAQAERALATPSAPLEGTGNGATEAEIRKSMTSEQIQLERKLTCEAIDGAMAFGYQNTNPPPTDDHWLAPYWHVGREQAELEAVIADVQPLLAQAADSDTERALSETIDERDQMEEIGTRLADAVGEFLGVDVGEWSSANNPILAAIEALESRAPRTDVAGAVPEGDHPPTTTQHSA